MLEKDRQEAFGRENPVDGSVTLGQILGETAKLARENLAPGLTLDKILSDVGEEMKHQWDHGRHELAQALFGNGEASGFVLYGRNSESRDEEHAKEAQQQERGGREM